MAKAKSGGGVQKNSLKKIGSTKRTSIGEGRGSRPKSKDKRRDWKPYVGQGK